MEATVGNETELNLTERDVPLLQRLLRKGYKVVTIEQLKERFCIDKIAEEMNSKNIEKLIEKYKVQGYKKFKVEKASYGRLNLYASKWWPWIGPENSGYKEGIPRLQGNINLCDINLLTDNIPDRCLVSMKKAKEIGLTEFVAATPVVEQRRMKDPVLLGVIKEIDEERSNLKHTYYNKVYVEIDMWE
jgi:hypothetical protein